MKFILSFLVGLLCVSASLGQTSKGFIVGKIADPNGAAIPNATVTATNAATGAVRTTTSQESGDYRLDAVDPGTYTLQISASGFTNARNDSVVVAATQTAEVNVQLSVGGATASVNVVSGESSVELQTTDGSRSNTLEQRQITELPIANLNPTNLVYTLPGVSDTSQTLAGGFVQGTEFSVNGLRARSNNQLIDGLDNNDNAITGQAYQPSVRDGYSEVAILQSNYSAEYGRAGGAVTNVITRSGTNQFRGSAYDLIQNSAFNSLTPGQRRNSLTKPPQSAENTFGFSLGGPLFLPRFGEGGPTVYNGRNKLFFFGTFQADLVRSNQQATDVVPTVNGYNTLRTLFPVGRSANLDYYLGIVGNSRGVTNPFTVPLTSATTSPQIEFGTASFVAPQPVNTYDYITRIDYTPTTRDSFTVRYLATKQNVTNQFPTVFQGFEVDVPSLTQNLFTSYTRNFSANLTNELRFGYGFVKANFTPRNSAISQAGPQINFLGTASDLSSVGLASTFPQGRRFSNYQLQDTVTYTIKNNTFRIGADLNLQRASQIVPFNSRGILNFADDLNGDSTDLNNFINGVSGFGGSVSRSFGSPVLFPNTFFQNYFINDEWKALSNLTFNLGLRYENYGTPFNKVAFPAFAGFNVPLTTVVKQKSDNNNFAPRFSFAYSPDFANAFGKRLFGDKETVIRGGFAVNYDVFFNNILGNTGASSPNVNGVLLQGLDQNVPLGVPASVTQLPTNPAFDPLAPITSIASNLQNPESYVYNLGIQRRLFQNYILDVAYVGSRGLRLFINEQVNPRVRISQTGTATQRLNPSRGSVVLRTNGGNSNYNSLQVRFERGFKNGFLLRSTYTFSKAIDDVNSEVFTTTGGTSLGSDPFNRRTDRSVASYDIPHVFTLTGLYNIPTFGTEGALRRIIGGFTVGGIFRAQSGAPQTVFVSGTDLNFDGSSTNDRPALSNPNAPANSFARLVNGRYVGRNGQPVDPGSVRYIIDRNVRTNIIGRNTLRGPVFQRLDMSLQREFGLGFTRAENLRFQVRGDVFNVLNIPTYVPGSGNILSQFFNDPYVNGEGTGRSARIQLRLAF